jgi:diguanylate cyclase (GGDEF)-like protein
MRAKLHRLLLAGWLVAGSLSVVAAQETRIPFRQITIRDGLPQNTVNAVVQDAQGFIWLGTQDGLARYDGRDFEVYRHERGDLASLADNWIWSLLVDSEGTLWIGTDGGGLDRWDPRAGTFTHLVNVESDPSSLSHNRVRVVFESSARDIWIGTEGGLNRFDRETGEIDRFLHDPSNPSSLGNDQVRDIIEDRQGSLWVATDGGGLAVLPAGGTEFSHFRHDPQDPRSLSEDRVRSVFEDASGMIWVGTYEGGLNRLDPETGEFDRFVHVDGKSGSLSDNRVRSIFQSRNGRIWVGTDAGLNTWLPGRDRFWSYQHSPADSTSLVGDRVTSIFQDRGGVIWVGSYGGVSTWNETTGSFSSYRHDPTDPGGSLANNNVNAFAEDDAAAIWIGTYGGLDQLDRETGQIRHFTADPSRSDRLQDNRVFSLLVDSRNVLWVGTFEGGLHRRLENQSFLNYRNDPSDPYSLSRDAVTVVREDGQGVIWVGTYGGGLNRYVEEQDRFVVYRHEPSSSTSIGSDKVLAIHEDSDGILWVGTDGAGLNGYDRSSGSFTRFRFQAADDKSLSHDSIFAILEDSEGTLWIGTQGGGLNRWSLEDRRAHRGRFRRYTAEDGLPNDVIYGILEDEQGMIWLSTNNGLAQLDPRTDEIRTFDESHGLLSKEFNFAAAYKTREGEMLFGGIEGFNSFRPADLSGNRYKPPVVLTSFLKLNQEITAGGPVSMLEGIRLKHSDYVVSFEFASLDYTAPEKNRYSYMLEGFDSGWNDLGSLNRATYTNLDPGSYTLRIRGSNSDGVWSDSQVELGILVAPPPWQTSWAYSIYALLSLAVVARLHYNRVEERRKEMAQRKLLEGQVEVRTRELAERNDDLQQAIEKLELASVTDSLTGLRNRRYLVNTIENDLALVDRFNEERRKDPVRAAANLQPDFLFLMFDLDGFKEINDSYGHAAGDLVLLQVRDILESVCRRSDTVIRWGGDEFLLIARHTSRETAERLAERIRSTVEAHEFHIGRDEKKHLTCSIGFAYYPFVAGQPSQLTWEQIVVVADRALYAAKNSGRNTWVGIQGTPQSNKFDAAGLVHLINDRLDTLVDDEIVVIRSAAESGQELGWARA